MADWRNHIPVWRTFDPAPLPPQAPHDAAPAVIVGSGPVGLALAIDLGMRGHRVIVLARYDFVPAGSKAICFSKRSLDILDRLGVGDAAVAKGVVWNVGKVFRRDRRSPIYDFDMLPIKDQKMPGFINLQQYHLEDLLIARLAELPGVDLRWGHEATGVAPGADGVRVEVACTDGRYAIDAEWLIACDGCHSPLRNMLGLDFEGRVFEDNFLIADIRMAAARPAERWFWFDPPFNPGRSALMHKQPDDVWRLDFQLGWDIDRAACVRPENVDPMIRGMLGADIDYEPVWYSVYTFQCRRMARFVHGRVIFAGDSAHLVSPFGARGCNGGLADADNLGWKLDLVLHGRAEAALIESYDREATAAADANILQSSRSTDFMTPKTPVSTAFRDAVLELAGELPFARTLVNSGRLSTAVPCPQSALNTVDTDDWGGLGIAPGTPMIDAPVGDGWLLERFDGRFGLIAHGVTMPPIADVPMIRIDVTDAPLAVERLHLAPRGAYLVRPDHYVAARWRTPTRALVDLAIGRATGDASCG